MSSLDERALNDIARGALAAVVSEWPGPIHEVTFTAEQPDDHTARQPVINVRQRVRGRLVGVMVRVPTALLALENGQTKLHELVKDAHRKLDQAAIASPRQARIHGVKDTG